MTDDEDDITSLRQLKARQREDWNEAVNKFSKGDKRYIRTEEANTAYERVLDTGDKAVPALEYVASILNLDDDWVKDVKSNPIGKHLLSDVMKTYASHPTTELMVDKGVWTVDTKRSVKSGATLSSVLNALSNAVNLTHRVDNLEQMVYMLAQHADQTDKRLDEIESVLSLPKDQLKEQVKLLHEEGYSQRAIADKVGKSQKTVSNWLKEMEI